ncbi:non-homologous end joining protein Ku [Streptomyces sparsus]
MARAIWTGVLTFGLVTVPVGLYTATEDHTVHFHQLQRDSGDRVRYRRVSERTGEELGSDDIVKGYDLGGGEYVVVEPDELAEIAPGRSRVIELAGFVDLERIEPVYFARTYYVAPQDKEYLKVYELLRAALRQSGKAGVATFTMRNKDHLTALRAQDDVLVLHTMHWADEVRDPRAELDLLPEGRVEVDERELETARQLIEALGIDWEPERFHDTSEERVQALVDANREGQEIVSEEGAPESTNVIDLMDTLRRSVERARSPEANRGSGSARGDDGPGGDGRGRAADNGEKAHKGGSRAGRKRGGGADGRRSGTRGRDEPEVEALEGLTKGELYERASRAGVAGRSKMNREQLVEALRGRHAAA